MSFERGLMCQRGRYTSFLIEPILLGETFECNRHDQMAKSYIASIGHFFQDLFKRMIHKPEPPGVCLF